MNAPYKRGVTGSNPVCVHQVRNLFRIFALIAKRKRRVKELAAGGSSDVQPGCQPCAELRVGKGTATTQSVYRKAIVPELRRGDEVMDQLFS